MKFATKLLSGAALALALSNTASASTYNIVSPFFNITLTTVADASSDFQAITAISGMLGSLNITGLSNNYGVDNTFKFSPTDFKESFTTSGIEFGTADLENWVFYKAYYGTGILNLSGTFDGVFPNDDISVTEITSVSAVPVPAAAWLFGSALLGAGALRRKHQAV